MDLSTMVSLVFAIVSAIIAIIMKVKESAEKAKKAIVEKDYTKLLIIYNSFKSDILRYIEKAEESGLSGAAKKSLVKENIIQLFSGHGIQYNDKEMDAIIERLIEFSKNVNKEDN